MILGPGSLYDPEPDSTVNMVEHPPHYTGHPKGIECIDVVEDNPFYNLGQAIRYIWRVSWGSKWDDIEDLRKARWYIDREIQKREERTERDQA